MNSHTPLLVLGLMSGTSLDGVDAALLRTDGVTVFERGPALTLPYAEDFRHRMRSILGRSSDDDGKVAALARELTFRHAEAVKALLARAGFSAREVDLIGFHGHTILHRPDEGRTWQIGYGELLAEKTGIPVMAGFRTQDVAAGGQGAPLAPLYHAALARDLDKPLAVLNIGGVANVTWIGSGADQVIAFDTGPGNALLDDWVWEATGRAMDENGRLAGAGKVNETVLAALLDNPWLDLPPPKSLDRNDFDGLPIQGLAPADGAATLAAFTAGTVRCAQRFFPAPVSRWLVCGGGRRNPALMVALRRVLDAPVEAVEAVGWDGDALEAQAFAFLAVRALYRLPLSLPGTTGVPRPLSGGRLHQAPGRAPLGLGGDG